MLAVHDGTWRALAISVSLVAVSCGGSVTPAASVPAVSVTSTAPVASPSAAVATANPAAAAPATVRNVTGILLGAQTWSGELLVTGDVAIAGDLTLKPGTIVRFAVGDDQRQGKEVAPDGFNNADPTRLVSYAIAHAELGVGGKLIAQGTADQPILFTSASATPKLADWQGLVFTGDGSQLEHVIVEWSRNGVTPKGPQPNSVIRDSIVRHTMWGCVSSGDSGMQVLNNDISDCGHEGVDIKGGSAVVRGNKIHESHSGIVVLEGSPTIDGNVITNVGDGIGGPGMSGARVGQNTVTLAPRDSPMEWRYGDFAYRPFECPPPCGR